MPPAPARPMLFGGPTLRALALVSVCSIVSALAPGCGARPGTVSVDIVTDLIGGLEVFRARVTLVPAGATEPGPDQTVTFTLTPGVPLGEGLRIAEFRNVPPGEHRMTVVLLGAASEVIATRTVRLHVVGNQVVPVVVSRDCILMRCPAPDDPEDATECLAGHCVAPECAAGGCASAECETDADCPRPTANCAVTRCAEGICLTNEVPGMCGPDSACSPDLGCVPIVISTDPSRDTDGDGAPDVVDCDITDPTIAPGAPEVCGDGIDQDCNGPDLPCPDDHDGDGSPEDEDCNDSNPAIYPSANEICDDGVDQDCDLYDLPCGGTDLDGDTWLPPNDCNDSDPIVHPYAYEICNDGRDQDCWEGDDRPPCIGAYGQPCGLNGRCLSSSRQRLACVQPEDGPQRQCLRCCVQCMESRDYHWLNVGRDCAGAASRYCDTRGGIRTGIPGLDPIQWGTCNR